MNNPNDEKDTATKIRQENINALTKQIKDQLYEDTASVKATFLDQKFRKKLKSWRATEVYTLKQLEDQSDMQLYESFKKQITEIINKSLSRFTEENGKNLRNWLDGLIALSALLPLVTAAITVGLLETTEAILKFLTNVISVVPPIFVKITTTRSADNYRGLELKAKCNALISEIHRLALIGKLKDELTRLHKEIFDIQVAASQIGAGS